MRIKILCPDGTHYVRAASDGKLDAVASVASKWETFEREDFDDGTFAIKTLDSHPHPGKYVRAVAGGGSDLVADRCVAKAHEKFTEQGLAGGKAAIRTSNGNFWRAKNKGGEKLDCPSTSPLAWEAFTIQPA